MLCDLHTHSYYSDGSFSPAQIVAQAKKADLVVALTDHNTVLGLPEFMEEAEKQGVTAVPGVELSTVYGPVELHLLGFFIPPEQYDSVEKLMKEFHVLKEISNMEMVERLNGAGYQIDYLSVKKRNASGNANRAHVAAELMDKGYVSSIREAFETLLGEQHGFYVPPVRLKTVDAIRFLRKIHAVPVLAHPLQELEPLALRQMLPEAIEAGLMGIETMHASYDAATIATATQIAEAYHLLPSGGSDFHGSNKPDISLGIGKGNLCIPLSFYQNLLQAHRSLQ